MLARNIQVQYLVKYETQLVTEAEYDLVYILYRLQKSVEAIKFIRQQYGLGLKEAKDVCDAIAAEPRDNNPNY